MSDQDYKDLRDDYSHLRDDFDHAMSENKKTPVGFVLASTLGIVGWLIVLGLAFYWIVQPVSLPITNTPAPITNGDTFKAGDVIDFRLEVSKQDNLRVIESTRFVRCEDGQLVTFTNNTQNLPVGDYSIDGSTPPLPDQVASQTTCEYVIIVEYRINPLRTLTIEFFTESFTWIPREDMT